MFSFIQARDMATTGKYLGWKNKNIGYANVNLCGSWENKGPQNLCRKFTIWPWKLYSNILLKRRILITFLQPTQQQTRYRKSHYAPSDGEGMHFFIIKILNLLEKLLILLFIIFIYIDGGSAPSEDSRANEWKMAGSNLVSWRPWLLLWYLYG